MKAGGRTAVRDRPQARVRSASRGRQRGARSDSRKPGLTGPKPGDGEPQAKPTATPTVTQRHATATPTANGHGEINAALLARAGAQLPNDGNGPTARSEQFADFQIDAPSCDNCGAITVRNGNCYLCHNCGSSMGCS